VAAWVAAKAVEWAAARAARMAEEWAAWAAAPKVAVKGLEEARGWEAPWAILRAVMGTPTAAVVLAVVARARAAVRAAARGVRQSR